MPLPKALSIGALAREARCTVSRATNFVVLGRPAKAARFKLAEMVLGLGKNGNLDPQQLADTAVQLMRAPHRG
jgi:hypothetical protein